MNEPILIVRTVSVEKLATVLDACSEHRPGHPIWVISSLGRCGELERDKRISHVVEYSQPGGFNVPIEIDQLFSVVVVPLSNWGGSGYANVLRACRQLKFRELALCRRCRTFSVVDPVSIKWKIRLEFGLGRLGYWFAGYWSERILDRD